MKIKLNTGICPIVDVGMYHSFLDPDHVFGDWSGDYYDCLPEQDYNYIYEASARYFNAEKYKAVVAQHAAEVISTFFDEISHIIKISLCEGSKIVSPKYYNYSSDTLDFTVEIEEPALAGIWDAVKGDGFFFKWAFETYKSRSGFISFMPYTRNAYKDAIGGKDVERALGMYLAYILESKLSEDDLSNPYQHALEEFIAYNYTMEGFIDDEKFHEIINGVAA